MPSREYPDLGNFTGIQMHFGHELVADLPRDHRNNAVAILEITPEKPLPPQLEEAAFAKVAGALSLDGPLLEDLTTEQASYYSQLVTTVAACAVPKSDGRIDVIDEAEIVRLDSLARMTLPGSDTPLGKNFLFAIGSGAQELRRQLFATKDPEEIEALTAQDIYRQVPGAPTHQ